MQWGVSSSLTVIASLFLCFAGDLVVAQISAPICTDLVSSWEWSFNSLDQNPCLVSAYLMSLCYGAAGFTVNPLDGVGDSYLPPTQEKLRNASSCWCSTVILSLLSACSECQKGLSTPWTQFTQNCPGIIEPSTFSHPVPTGTRVPQWALLDITRANIWNATAAQIVGDTPEFFPGELIGTSASSPSRKSNTGAIAGGVAGGVVAIAAIAGLVFIFWRRQQRAKASPAASLVNDVSPPLPPSPMTQVHSAQTPSYADYTQGSRMSLYDPNNPNTYPQLQEHPLASTPSVNAPVVSYDGYLNGSSPTNMQPLRTQGYHGLPTV
ncbi:hypothetical protein EDB92DRAFT_711416 [Lactarius akahatsu]|uniref:Transmembrane protein n=1 Tax=Lactarius akahatsu TaxID=416441 RepID=A0AAD4L2R0_9AGAM|nr:hypothetical protein EDB92DRAFT_711416 [Lactarius akahatsu]